MAQVIKTLLAVCLVAFCVGTVSAGVFKSNACIDNDGQGYAGLIPHSSDCKHHFLCQEETPGSPIPIFRECPPTLDFNFEKCACDYPGVAICYDPNNQDHVSRFYKCATRLP